MQSGPALGAGSLISESGRIRDLVFEDPFYVVYSAETTASGATIGITEYFPADLVARSPGGDVLLRSLELQDLFCLGRDRFMAEARALSALRHPNLIRFDGVVSDHGTAFAFHAAEEGEPLTNLVKSVQQPLCQEEIDRILKQLISALEHLHSRDLIHANITPDTILLRPDPLLIRFGATRSFLAARMRKVNLAVTPGYSAPELHFSDRRAHAPLCDIFSLAAVLYFVVTGRHPINVISRGLGHTMPPAAAMSSQRFRPEFLEAIDRGLELEPERRPATIKAFGEMLFGVPQKKAHESPQPALQPATNLAEGSQVNATSSAASPNATSATAARAVSKSSASAPNRDTEDEDDDFDKNRDFGSGWRGLGIGGLLVLVLALVISAGLWMLEAQFKKPPEQSARLDPQQEAASQSAAVQSTAPKKEPPQSGSRESFATAKALDRIRVTPRPGELPERTAAVPEPRSEMTPAEASAKQPLADKDSVPPSGEAPLEKPQVQELKETTTAKRPRESSAHQPANPSTERTPEAASDEPQAKEHGNNAVAPALPPEKSAEKAPAQVAKAAPWLPEASASPPAHEPEKRVFEKAPERVAKAELPPPPLPEASVSSPAGFTFKDCDDCPQLVVVPKGEFMMGSNKHPHEKPAHRVQIAYPFAIGQHEVTYAEWDRCVDAGICRYWPESHGSPNDAIGNLSWDDANAYLKWMSLKTHQTYRLPSEAEWEYAAHAGSDKPTAAGSQKGNPLGLLDTAGKMAEWVEDCWNDFFAERRSTARPGLKAIAACVP